MIQRIGRWQGGGHRQRRMLRCRPMLGINGLKHIGHDSKMDRQHEGQKTPLPPTNRLRGQGSGRLIRIRIHNYSRFVHSISANRLLRKHCRVRILGVQLGGLRSGKRPSPVLQGKAAKRRSTAKEQASQMPATAHWKYGRARGLPDPGKTHRPAAKHAEIRLASACSAKESEPCCQTCGQRDAGRWKPARECRPVLRTPAIGPGILDPSKCDRPAGVRQHRRSGMQSDCAGDLRAGSSGQPQILAAWDRPNQGPGRPKRSTAKPTILPVALVAYLGF